MKGLYILTSPLLKQLKTCKLGMSLDLQLRLNDYKSTFFSPSYYSCFVLPEDYDKRQICCIKNIILKETESYNNELMGLEYCAISEDTLDNLVKEILKKYNIDYTYHYPVKFLDEIIIEIPKKVSYYNGFSQQYEYYSNVEQYQREFINKINDIFSVTDKCHIETTDRSDNGIISFTQACKYDFSVIIVPSLSLVEQFYLDHKEYAEKYKILCICSNKTINGVTDINYINTFLRDNNKIIIIMTYLSFNVFFKCTEESSKYPSIIIFNECQYVTKSIYNKLQKYNNTTKYLFLSNNILQNNIDYGKLIVGNPHNNTETKICGEFDVIIDLHDDITRESIYRSIVKNSIFINGENTVMYNITSNDFSCDMENMEKMLNNIFLDEYPDNECSTLIKKMGNDSKYNDSFVKEFINNNVTLNVLLYSGIFDKDIDIKNVNSVCFCEPRHGKTEIINNIKTITKKVNEKNNYKNPTIIIPVDVTKKSNYAPLKEIVDSLNNNSNIIIFKKGIYDKTIKKNNIGESLNIIKELYKYDMLHNHKKNVDIVHFNRSYTKDEHLVISPDNVSDKMNELYGHRFVYVMENDKYLMVYRYDKNQWIISTVHFNEHISNDLYQYYKHKISAYNNDQRESYMKIIELLKYPLFQKSVLNAYKKYSVKENSIINKNCNTKDDQKCGTYGTKKYNNNEISYILDNNGIPWVLGNQIASALKYAKPYEAIKKNVHVSHKKRLSELTTNKFPFKNTQSAAYFINDDGVASLILKSKKKVPAEFKLWIIDNLIPKLGTKLSLL